jgi:hypothetical protein
MEQKVLNLTLCIQIIVERKIRPKKCKVVVVVVVVVVVMMMMMMMIQPCITELVKS